MASCKFFTDYDVRMWVCNTMEVLLMRHRLSGSVPLVAFLVFSTMTFAYGQDAHTNYRIESLQQDQKLQTASPVASIKMNLRTSQPKIQILLLPSSQVDHSSNLIAQAAFKLGVNPPAGAEITAHTDFTLAGSVSAASLVPLPSIGNVANNTPQDIRNRYGLQKPSSSVGPAGVIVIVDVNHYPTAEADLAKFSSQYGLPPCSVKSGCLQIIEVDPARTLTDTDPRNPDCGWAVESAIDLQWAHAIAPLAKLVLVEAASHGATDLFLAVDKATSIAENAGGGIVSLSWSFDEFDGEGQYDSHFTGHNNVLYFAASGDQGGLVEYPSASRSVISVGGTQLIRDADNTIQTEVGWSSSGGGPSRFESKPVFQNSPLENVTATEGRVTPDIAGPAGLDYALANGSPIFAGTVCSPYSAGWFAAGGTSLATPILAAATSLSFPKGAKPSDVLANIYAQRKNINAVKDITAGQAGANLAAVGFDPVTGVGVPKGLQFALPISNP
jgi:subtilase family serine protease